MSFDKTLEDDFGPVRMATAAEINQVENERKARRGRGKAKNLAKDTTTVTSEISGAILSETKGASEKDKLPQVRPNGDSLKDRVPMPSRKRKLVLKGQEELKRYLEDKLHRMAIKQQQKEEHKTTGNRVKVLAKRRKLVLKPMDESYKQKILADLREKNERKNKISEANTGGKHDETQTNLTDEALIEITSESSELEFEDASEQLSEPQKTQSIPNPEKAPTSNVNFPPSGLPKADSDNKIDETEASETHGGDKVEHQSDLNTTENMPFQDTIHVSENDCNRMRKLILSQLNGNKRLPIEKTTLAAPYKEICSIFRHTIEDCESQTVLLTGAPGLGKTTLVEHALKKLEKLNAEEFITIRLSGSLHFTDQHAIREIARQLDTKLRDYNEDLGEDKYEQRSINDTFQNILSTLLKLDERGENEEDDELPIRVIFIIDEMEKFTENPRQTLLYNLFELAQVSKVPICIVGITPRVTIREFFEKRVRSRFSQRMIQTKKAESLEAFWQDAKIGLSVPESVFGEFENQRYPQSWNEQVEHLFRTRTGLTKIVFRTYYTTKNYRQLHNECALPVSKITQANAFVNPESFGAYSQNAVRGIEAVVASLSTAELLTVVAAARWITRSNPPHVNFKLAYREYTEMMKTSNMENTTLSSKTSYIDNLSLAGIKITRNAYPAKVLRGCWRAVYRTGLLFDIISAYSETNSSNNANMYKEAMIDDSKMLQLDVTLEELAKLIPQDSFVRRFTRL